MTQIRLAAAAASYEAVLKWFLSRPESSARKENQKHIKGVDFGGENEQKFDFWSGALSCA